MPEHTASDERPHGRPPMAVLRSTRVLAGDRFEAADVVLTGGRVAGVEAHGSVEQAEDLGDVIVAPGFVDLQLNGAFGHDLTGDPGSLWEVAARLPEHGVTSFLPTVITAPEGAIDRAFDALASRPPGFVGAEPLGLHLEGPLLSPDRAGAHPTSHLRVAVDTDRWRPPAVRMVTVAPEVAGTDLIAELAGRGVVVSLGHSDADAETAAAGFAAGASHVTHLFSAMRPFLHREPGLVGAALADSGVAVSMICDGVHTHPTTLAVVFAAVGPDRFVPTTDAIAALGMPPGAHRLGTRAVATDGRAATLADGTLAGSVLSMPMSVANLVEMAGADLATSLRCHATSPARAIGVTDRGVIAVGRRADLVLLDDDLTVLRTVVGGEAVFGR